MTEAVHEGGALAGIQLYSGGIGSMNNEMRTPPMAVSPLQSELSPFGRTGYQMTKDDIKRAQHDYVAAAKRARSADFDIVEFHSSHGGRVIQFLSPVWNQRTDEYGGSFNNRTRFFRETITLLKEEIGDDCAIQVRFSIASFGSAGIEIDDGLEFIAAYDHLVDIWNINISTEAELYRDTVPSRAAPQGFQMEWTGQAKKVATKPVIGVSRFTDPDLMVELVTGGVIDIIGAARPSIVHRFCPRRSRRVVSTTSVNALGATSAGRQP